MSGLVLEDFPNPATSLRRGRMAENDQNEKNGIEIITQRQSQGLREGGFSFPLEGTNQRLILCCTERIAMGFTTETSGTGCEI